MPNINRNRRGVKITFPIQPVSFDKFHSGQPPTRSCAAAKFHLRTRIAPRGTISERRVSAVRERPAAIMAAGHKAAHSRRSGPHRSGSTPGIRWTHSFPGHNSSHSGKKSPGTSPPARPLPGTGSPLGGCCQGLIPLPRPGLSQFDSANVISAITGREHGVIWGDATQRLPRNLLDFAAEGSRKRFAATNRVTEKDAPAIQVRCNGGTLLVTPTKRTPTVHKDDRVIGQIVGGRRQQPAFGADREIGAVLRQRPSNWAVPRELHRYRLHAPVSPQPANLVPRVAKSRPGSAPRDTSSLSRSSRPVA